MERAYGRAYKEQKHVPLNLNQILLSMLQLYKQMGGEAEENVGGFYFF
jgi:hypothetical protein